MDKKYLPSLERCKQILFEQINECQTLIYRNSLENLTFIEKKDQDKQTEVKTNNGILSRKLDLLFQELERLNAEKPVEDTIGSGVAQPGAAV